MEPAGERTSKAAGRTARKCGPQRIDTVWLFPSAAGPGAGTGAPPRRFLGATSPKEDRMASDTKTRSRSSGGGNKTRSGETSAFSWGGGGSAGVLAGAALAGAAMGLAANMGRKLFVQMSTGAMGDWFDALKAEHQATLALFDKIEAT